MRRLLSILLILGALTLTESCKLLYPERMFKEGDYTYMALAERSLNEYKIAPEDIITMRIFSQEGMDLVDFSSIGESGGQMRMMQGGGGGQQQGQGYPVRYDGYVDLPLFGELYVEGLTEDELREYLENEASKMVQDPFVVLQVTNRRAFVFKDSKATVVQLNQGPTTLIEVIARAGGLERDLKAYKMKLIRGDLSNPQVQEIDLSTMEGLADGDLIVQSNDIIYIQRRLRVTRDVLGEFTTILTLLTSLATVVALVRTQ